MSQSRTLASIALAGTFALLTACGAPAAQTSLVPTAMSHKGAAININTAILSQLDKIEAAVGVPGLSNQIQASRPYASPEELVSKNVLTQPQFDQVKSMVTIEDVVLTGEARDIDYLIKLGLMKGHLLVAQELLDLKQPAQAIPHIGHPVEEIYVDLEEQLTERQVKEFKSVLIALQDLIKANPNSPKIARTYTEAMTAIDGAIQGLPARQRQSPAFVLQVIDGLLDAAGTEYRASIAQGKIAAVIEYQDSRGFVRYADQLFQQIAPQLAKTQPDAHQTISASLKKLRQAWPKAIAPAAPILSTEEVLSAIQSIERIS
ncbi:helix-hairpin-helix domain-containing protein [Anthocerotibacter panamensis]|uniref:helix-hairpin-helix domain-containing protein n=1 Tax=Anthocerotibacter panamensis TaxID=2857077 RepID=UPI001C402D35|nr:helix-hairpin-helix domain-containing protein [Anthocerotibacter panamensis]